MIKRYDNAMEISLRERALETQQSVEAVAKLVDAVHRHKVAAIANQVALTTETNELKKKQQKCKEMEKAQERGKLGMLSGMAKDITNSLFNKRSKEDPSPSKSIATMSTQNDEPPPFYEPATEANVTEAELAASKREWKKKKQEAREERVIFTRDEGRERMVNQMCYEAVKARQDYEALKEEYELEAHAKNFNPNVPSMTISVEKKLSLRDMKRVMMPLVPGQEIGWATLMEHIVTRGIQGEEALALQALIPQLMAHGEVAAKATSLLVQAAGKPDKEKKTLSNFFNWTRSTYKLSPRKKRGIFARKIREMRWDWKSNPVDKITSILAETQLTWEEVVNQPALREELEAAMASKLNITLKLEITQRSPAEWKQAITEIWESVKNVTSPELH